MKDYVSIEGMPQLVEEITPQNAMELVEQLNHWEADLLIGIITVANQYERDSIGILIQDVFNLYRGAARVLATGESMPVHEYRQVGGVRLAEIVAMLATSEANPNACVLEGLARCAARVSAEEREAAHADGREEERQARRGAIERAVRGALAQLDREVRV